MSQAIKDWIEQDVDSICAQCCDGEITRDVAIRELERLGFDTAEARAMVDGVLT